MNVQESHAKIVALMEALSDTGCRLAKDRKLKRDELIIGIAGFAAGSISPNGDAPSLLGKFFAALLHEWNNLSYSRNIDEMSPLEFATTAIEMQSMCLAACGFARNHLGVMLVFEATDQMRIHMGINACDELTTIAETAAEQLENELTTLRQQESEKTLRT